MSEQVTAEQWLAESEGMAMTPSVAAAKEAIEGLLRAIHQHREYIHNARNRWPSGVDGVQVTSGDIELWRAAGLE